MYLGKKVSIVFSTYNEKETIRQQIEDCFATKVVDEVVVINNNAAKGTTEEVKKTKAKLFFEPKQGFGHGYIRGLREATGDIIILSEPDGSFRQKDILKLLAYSEDFDVVFGTRTTQASILKGANMGLFLKWGNWFVAKLIEFNFNTTHLSDAGCTMRLIKKAKLKKIQPYFREYTSYFNPEFMALVAIKKISFIEIPVTYGPRVGESMGTKNKINAFIMGLNMIWVVFRYRFASLFKKF